MMSSPRSSSTSRPSRRRPHSNLTLRLVVLFHLPLITTMSVVHAQQQQQQQGLLNNTSSHFQTQRINTIETSSSSSNYKRKTAAAATTTTTRQSPSMQSPEDECASCQITDSILFPWFVELMGCVILFVLVQYNIPVPYAACLFIFGAVMGAVASLRLADNPLSNSIQLWANIDSALLLLIFLPGLIFKDAVEINFNMFIVAIWQLWILSFPMVLMGTFLVAFAGIYIMPYGWGLGASATLGAILSSTDPIAVASVLKTSGASPRLVMHIQGESLLNDGSAFVFFTIFSKMFYYELGIPSVEKIGLGEGFVLFFQMSLGGIAVGTAFGIGLLGVIYELDRRLEKEFDILQVVAGLSVAYLAYWVCDQILTMSGVVACVSVGMVVNAFGRSMINDEKSFGQYLALAEFLLNTLLFTLGGVIWGSVSFETTESYQIRLYDWGWLMVLYLLVLAFRFLQVGTFYPILSRIGLKSSPSEAIFLAYGGLRGAVGVALGLSLIRFVFENTEDFDARKVTTIVQFMGGGVTLLTLSLNGTSAGWILTKLGLSKPKVSKEREKIAFEGAAKDFVYDQVEHLFQVPRFQRVDFQVLKKHVPFITTEPSRLTMEAPEGHSTNVNDYRSHANHTISQRVASHGDQYMRAIDSTQRMAQSLQKASSEENLKQNMIIELRQVFLELLAEAYNLQLEMGELDEKEDDGNIHDVLIHSVNLATNAVEHEKKPIQDWEYLSLFSSYVGNDVTDFGSSDVSNSFVLRSSFMHGVVSNTANQSEDLEQKKRKLRRIRHGILKAIAFKEGHMMAETRLQLYVNRIHNSMSADESLRNAIQPSLEQVLDESKAQVSIAEKILEENVDETVLNIFMSHYCARILLHRLIAFTERKFEDGLVSKLDARKYLSDLDRRIRDLLKSGLEQALEEFEHQGRPQAKPGIEEDNISNHGPGDNGGGEECEA